jgi:hypothetical protein
VFKPGDKVQVSFDPNPKRTFHVVVGERNRMGATRQDCGFPDDVVLLDDGYFWYPADLVLVGSAISSIICDSPGPRCECGSHAVGSPGHSTWSVGLRRCLVLKEVFGG